MLRLALLTLLLVGSAYSTMESATCYDHQTVDYKAQFDLTECNQECTVTTYFSPEHSLDTYLDLIETAKESIDIYTPGIRERVAWAENGLCWWLAFIEQQCD